MRQSNQHRGAEHDSSAEDRQETGIRVLAHETHKNLTELAAGHLSYFMASFITYNSLYGLITIDQRVNQPSGLPTDLVRAGRLATKHLPFSTAERAQLYAHMHVASAPSDPRSAAMAWYEEAIPDDTVILDRWQRWLRDQFDPYRQERAFEDEYGQRLIDTLGMIADGQYHKVADLAA